MVLRFTVTYPETGETIADIYYSCDYVTAFEDLMKRVDAWFENKFGLSDWFSRENRRACAVAVTLSSHIRR